MAKDYFQALPNELFGEVLTHLDLPSIQRLRLTSTSYASKCLCPAFIQYYSHQVTDLTPSSIGRLFQVTTHPILGPAIKDLTVDTVFYDPSEVIRSPALPGNQAPDTKVAQEHARLLLANTQRLAWLMSKRHEQRGQFIDDVVVSLAHILEDMGSLSSLRLRCRIVREPCWSDKSVARAAHTNWNALWADCHRLLRIVTLAMTRSKVSVDTLSIFDESFGKVQAIAFTELSTDLTRLDFLTAAGAKIKNLNLSFSTATPVPLSDIIFNHDGSMDHRRARCLSPEIMVTGTPDFFLGIAAFLKLTPELECLDLYLYNTLSGHPAVYDRLFVHISKDVHLPKLRRLTLRGIRAPHDALLFFLRKHPDITELDLREVHISGGTWDTIFKAFQHMPKLSKLHLENLWSGSQHLLNLEPADPSFDDGKRGPGHSYGTKNGVMVHTRDITTEELRQEGGLKFRTVPGRSRGMGSRALVQWMLERVVNYGPPQR
ncbi:hypothetical protein VMCG_09364 [Cytospora schulzeri]|uniref:Uncharacterized protein n=1 Tax=Cytospora schulzeri TaxID=448051 RepID=A0A423VJU4_9PEZI|nr:hypothetical protein VMCG_09364 [Valsa malicola]